MFQTTNCFVSAGNTYLVCSFSITVNYIRTLIYSEWKGEINAYTLEFSSVLVQRSLCCFDLWPFLSVVLKKGKVMMKVKCRLNPVSKYSVISMLIRSN